MNTLVCRTCQVDQPLDTDHFFKERSVFGWRLDCKTCTNRKKQAWRVANPERHRESNRIQTNRYYHEHKNVLHPRVQPVHPAKTRSTTHKTDEERNEQRRDYKATHVEEILMNNRAYRATHADTVQATIQAWRKRHPEKNQLYKATRRARELAAPINDLTQAQWKAIKEAFDHRCAYCRRKMKRLTMDHITPLSKGGSHTLHNVIPACQSCNSRKHTSGPLVPVQPLLLVFEDTKKVTY